MGVMFDSCRPAVSVCTGLRRFNASGLADTPPKELSDGLTITAS